MKVFPTLWWNPINRETFLLCNFHHLLYKSWISEGIPYHEWHYQFMQGWAHSGRQQPVLKTNWPLPEAHWPVPLYISCSQNCYKIQSHKVTFSKISWHQEDHSRWLSCIYLPLILKIHGPVNLFLIWNLGWCDSSLLPW